MRATELKKVLATCIRAGLPVLIKGAPGVGKSDIVSQASAECEAELVISHPVVSDPTDFKGLPSVQNGKAEFLPFGDLRRLITAKKRTVAFLDDLGQAPAVVQAAAMQLILARQVNGFKISDKVTFVAATNRREDRAGVTGILEPVKSRFASIVELDINVDDWSTWALAHEVPPEVVAFVRFRPALLMSGKATNDIVNSPCPRTVTFMGKLLTLGLRSQEVLAGAVGTGFAAEFVGFLKIFESLPSIDGILVDPDRAAVPTDPAALFAVSTALAQKAKAETARQIIRYANRLPDEFGVLTILDSARAYPGIKTNSTFIQWAADHQDILV